MKEISIEELKRDAGQWIRLAASKEPVIITDGGKPVATLTGLEPLQARALRSRSVMIPSSARSIVSVSLLVPSSFRARLILVSSRA